MQVKYGMIQAMIVKNLLQNNIYNKAQKNQEFPFVVGYNNL